MGRTLSLRSLGACRPCPGRLTLSPLLDLHMDSHSLSKLEAMLHPAPVPALILFGDSVQGQGDELVILVAAHGALPGGLVLAGQRLATFIAPLAPVFLIGEEFARKVARELESLSLHSSDILGCLEVWFSWSKEGERNRHRSWHLLLLLQGGDCGGDFCPHSPFPLWTAL